MGENLKEDLQRRGGARREGGKGGGRLFLVTRFFVPLPPAKEEETVPHPAVFFFFFFFFFPSQKKHRISDRQLFSSYMQIPLDSAKLSPRGEKLQSRTQRERERPEESSRLRMLAALCAKENYSP